MHLLTFHKLSEMKLLIKCVVSGKKNRWLEVGARPAICGSMISGHVVLVVLATAACVLHAQ